MMMRAFSIYENRKVQLFSNLIRPGMTVLDIGANKGYFTLLFAKLMHDKGRVLAFEPHPDNCFWIQRSIHANHYHCINLCPLALSNTDGEATFYVGKRSGWGSLRYSPIAHDNQVITVTTRKLDTILHDEDIANVDLIQMDVEGSDLAVLQGAANTLQQHHHITITMDVDVRGSTEQQQLYNFFHTHKYKILDLRNNMTLVQNAEKLPKEIVAVPDN